MATNLPTDIAGSYPDRSQGDRAHQQHHDTVHGAVNELSATVESGRLSEGALNNAFAGRIETGLRPNLTVQTLMWSPDESVVGVSCTISPDLVNYKVGDRGIKMTMDSGVTGHVVMSPMQPTSPLPHPPASTIGLWVWLDDAALVSSILIDIRTRNLDGSTSMYSRSSTNADFGSTLRDGWNLLRWPAHASSIGDWTQVDYARVRVGATAATTATVGHLWLECPKKAQLIFINDGASRSFDEVCGAAMRARGLPMTWAIGCTNTETATPSSTMLTEAELHDRQAIGDSVSFHNYGSDTQIMSTATPEETRLWTWQAQKWLQSRGFNGWFYRAAWLQNTAPNAAAAWPLLAAAPTHVGESSLNSWPLTRRMAYPRITLHGLGASNLDNYFSIMERTHQTFICYTHHLNDAGGVDITNAEWDRFMGKVDTALTEGWLEGVTFETLFARAGAKWRESLSGPVFEYHDEFGNLVTLGGSDQQTGLEQTVIDVAESSASITEAMLLQDARRAKGGVIGVGNKAAVALRFDDWHEDFKANILPLLKARGIPAGFACISRLTEQPWSDTITAADIRSWNNHGIEVWSHGTDHKDPSPQGDAGIIDQIVNSKAEIEAWGVKCQGWMHPGATPVGPDTPYGTGFNTVADLSDTFAGRLLRKTYPLSESYVGGTIRPIPTGQYHGLDHITISDGVSYSSATSSLDYTVQQNAAREFMIHSGNIGQAGNMTLTEFTNWLDHLVSLRDSGKLDVVTPSGLYFVDRSDSRFHLVDQGFEDWSTGMALPLNWSGTFTGKTIETSGGHSGNNFLRITSSTSNFISYRANSLQDFGLGGETFIFEGWARSNGAGTTVSRVLLYDYGDNTRLNLSLTRTGIGSAWTKVTHAFSLHPDTDSLFMGLGRNSGDGIDWDDVKIYKV